MSNKHAMFLPTIFGVLLFSAGTLPLSGPFGSVDDIEAIAFDIHSGEILAAQSGQGLMTSRLVGSLAKPLVAYALISSGRSAGEVFYCRASSPDEQSTKTCWYKPGHGNLTFVQALSQSCNAWFRQWLHNTDDSQVIAFFNRLGMFEIAESTPCVKVALALCGLDGDLKIPSLSCAAGFAALFNGGVVFNVQRGERGVSLHPVGSIEIDAEAAKLVAAGMLECSASGTGSAFGEILGPGSALVKTGTAYAETSEESGELLTDGWCIALYPANVPRYLVLVRLPGGSGAKASEEAALFLKSALEKSQ